MTTRTTDYDAPAVWAPHLIAWANEQAEFCEDIVRTALARNAMAVAEKAQARAREFHRVADRARVRLVDISGLTAADVEPQALGLADACAAPPPEWTPPVFAPATSDEPPGTLVELVRYLRERWESVLPGLTTEAWQTIGCAVWLRWKGGER